MGDDPRFAIEAIQPLLSHERQSGPHLMLTFTCPKSGRHVQARYTVQPSVGSQVASRVTSHAKQSAFYELRRTAHSMLNSVLGPSLGRIAGSAVDSAFYATQGPVTSASTPALSAQGRSLAIVEAFRSVSGEFSFVNGTWVHKTAAKELLSPFERLLFDNPFGAYEKQVAARLCLEIAAASGGVSDEERSQLEDALDTSGLQGSSSLDALSKRPPLTRAELGEVSAGCKLPLMALGWTIAYADEAFDAAEQARLDTVADGLALSAPDRAKARDLARSFLLDQWFDRAFAFGGHDVHLREQAVQLGLKIGMTRDEVEVAEAKFQKRRA